MSLQEIFFSLETMAQLSAKNKWSVISTNACSYVQSTYIVVCMAGILHHQKDDKISEKEKKNFVDFFKEEDVFEA